MRNTDSIFGNKKYFDFLFHALIS